MLMKVVHTVATLLFEGLMYIAFTNKNLMSNVFRNKYRKQQKNKALQNEPTCKSGIIIPNSFAVGFFTQRALPEETKFIA
jgi:hypothetical protein